MSWLTFSNSQPTVYVLVIAFVVISLGVATWVLEREK